MIFYPGWYLKSIMMIGGGDSGCAHADHGIGITAINKRSRTKYKYDFGNIANPSYKPTPSQSYSLNLWIRWLAARPKSIPYIFSRIIFDAINKRNKRPNFQNRFKKLDIKLANICQPQKTADILPRHCWFLVRSERQVLKFLTDDVPIPRSG